MTGAEPWNIVVSPDGRRVFVANSGQDTITVIDARAAADHRPRRPAQQPLQRPRPRPPLPAARPRGHRRTATRLYVTRFLAFTRPGGKQADDNGQQGVVCRLTSTRRRPTSATTGRARRITLGAAGHRLHRRPRRRRHARPDLGVPEPAAEHRDPRQPGLPAEHRRLAARAAAVQRRHAGLRERRSAASSGDDADAGAGKFINLHLGAREPGAGQEEAVLRERVGDRLHEPAGAGIGLRRLRRQRPAGQGQRRRRTAS